MIFQIIQNVDSACDTLMFCTENVFYFEEYAVNSRALDLSEQMLTLPVWFQVDDVGGNKDKEGT